MTEFEIIRLLKIKIKNLLDQMDSIQESQLKYFQGMISAYKQTIYDIQRDHIEWKLKQAGLSHAERCKVLDWLLYSSESRLDSSKPEMNLEIWDEIMDEMDEKIKSLGVLLL